MTTVVNGGGDSGGVGAVALLVALVAVVLVALFAFGALNGGVPSKPGADIKIEAPSAPTAPSTH